ncbi:Forkhead-associated (FHA) domain-containing protein [Abeliophyllum distichum]|uniref:Forkhead-associated (FHA) domain-containing protein n=1 Tax=Abeliophyllum distichum TaxID=126358 RepID=A0ABD1V566_9LAMI
MNLMLQVILGRSTEDIDVDIDLSKEGRANKISRRQALIKMEADGSFFLRNLGKSPVSVNGIAIATGQLLILSSSCLIEIRGMSFVFEVNERNVRQHLENVAQKKERKDERI